MVCKTLSTRRYHLTLFYPTDHITLPLSAVVTALMVAQVVAAPMAAVLMSLDGALDLRGWQWLAVVEGCAAVAVGLLLNVLMPSSPARVRSLAPEEMAWVSSSVSRCAFTIITAAFSCKM